MTKESAAAKEQRRRRRKIALVACGALAAAVVCGGGRAAARSEKRGTSDDAMVPQLSEVIAEAVAARDEAEELAVSGDVDRAVALLERVSRGWSKTEPGRRSAADFASDASRLLDDANQAVAQVRATLGSLFVEKALAETRRRDRSALAGKAVRVLGPTCPTLWYSTRKTSPGDEHVRGEVGWVRCYGDLIRSRRIRGEVDLAGLVERDVASHSTPWLRLRRDTKHLRHAKNERVRRRRIRDVAKRWPTELTNLREPKSATKPRESSARAERDQTRVETIMALSRMSALSPSERAVTARDFGRAKTKARDARRQLDEAARKFCAGNSDDALARARHLATLKDVAAAATADLHVFSENDDRGTSSSRSSSSGGENEADETTISGRRSAEDDEDVGEEEDEMARWNAGVALAAMLRASQSAPANETAWTSTETTKGALENALDALVAKNDDEIDAAVSSSTASSAGKPPPFGRAFARHVAAEAAEYVSVAVGAHQHGWQWLHVELSRINNSLRRAQLSIAPEPGPPVGFLSRADILQNFIAMRERGGARPPNQKQQRHASSAQQQKSSATHKATRTSKANQQHQRLEDELTTARSISLAAFGAFALSAAHGTALLRERQRKDSDGYARRRPKRTILESAWGVGAHLCLAVCVCLVACWNRAKKAMPPVKQDAKQLLGALRALAAKSTATPRSSRSNAAVSKSSSRSAPASSSSSAANNGSEDAKNFTRGRRLDSRGSPPPAVRVSPAQQEESLSVVEKRDEPAENYAVVSNEDEDSVSDASFSSSPQQTTAGGDEWKPVPKGGRVQHQGPRILATTTKKAAAEKIGVRDQAAVALNVGVSAIPVVVDRPQPSAESEKKRVTVKPQKEENPMSSGIKNRKKPGPSTRGGGVANPSEWKRKPRSQTTWVPYHHQTATIPIGEGGGVDPRAASPVSVVPDNADKREAIRYQVEYYFSVSNLCKDVYLRTQCMDSKGYVSLRHICSFKRVWALTDDPNTVREALKSSTKLEVVDAATPDLCKVRTRDHPERWIAPMLRTSGETTPENE